MLFSTRLTFGISVLPIEGISLALWGMTAQQAVTPASAPQAAAARLVEVPAVPNNESHAYYKISLLG